MSITGPNPAPGPGGPFTPDSPSWPSPENSKANELAQLTRYINGVNAKRVDAYNEAMKAYQYSVTIRPDIKPAWPLPTVPKKLALVDGVPAETAEPACAEIPVTWPAPPPALGTVDVGPMISPGWFAVGPNDRMPAYALVEYQGMKLKKIPSVFGGQWGAGGWYQVVP